MATVADTTAGLAKIAVVVIPILIIVGLIIVVLWLIMKTRKVVKDNMLEEFREMVADAKINRPPHMKALYRLPIPFLGDFIDEKRMTDENRGETMKELRGLFNRNKRAVYLGTIVGFNRVDMLATIEDYLMPKGMEDKPLLDEESQEEIAELKKVFETYGRFLNFVVYKPRDSSIWKPSHVEGVLAFDDQLLGVDSDDGILTLLGEGTDRLGIYFSLPSGYVHRVKSVLTYLISRGWIRWATRLEAIHIETTEEAIRMDAGTKKLMNLKAVEGLASISGGKKDGK